MLVLKDITIQVWKTQHGNKIFETNLKKENDNEDDECNDDNDKYIIIYICLNCILEYKKNIKLKFQIFNAQILH